MSPKPGRIGEREREERRKRRDGEKKEERGEGRKKAGEDSGVGKGSYFRSHIY